MPLASALIINPQITASRRGIAVSHLPLNIKEIRVIPYRVHRIRISELMRCQVSYSGPLAQLPQILPHTPGSEASPLATTIGNKQRIQGRGQRQRGAGFKPVFNFFSGFPVENNDPVLMGLSTSNECGPMAFLNRNILNRKPSQFANPQAGIQRQRPQRQGPHIKPVTFAFTGPRLLAPGPLLQVAKQLLQLLTPRRAGQQFGMGRLFGKLDRIRRQLAALVEPGEPDFKRLIVTFNARFLEAAPFAIVEKCVNAFRRGRPAVVGEGAELVERGFVVEDGLFGFARFGRQEIGNGPVHKAGVIRLNQFQVAGRISH